MALDICAEGVDPNAYDDFVDYLVESSSPTNSIVSGVFADNVVNTSVYITTVILIIIFIGFVIVVILLVALGYIGFLTSLALVFGAIAILTLYFLLTYQYVKSSTYALAPLFQETLIQAVALTSNSVIRDVVYTAACA